MGLPRSRTGSIVNPVCGAEGVEDKDEVPGTEGYAQAAQWLIPRYESIGFDEKYRAVMYLLPLAPGAVLDIGAGTGVDAAWLAQQGHEVVAVEPLTAFREAGRALHPAQNIEWVDDSLPLLARVADRRECFDLVLLSAVWQHLAPDERSTAMTVMLPLLKPGAILVMSVRHGPAPEGRRSFDVSIDETIAVAGAEGGRLLLAAQLPSVQALNREAGVTWSWLVFQKTGQELAGACLRPA